MKIFSVAFNMHDHNTYDGVYHHQLERTTRHKHNIYGRNEQQVIRNFYKKNYQTKNDRILACSATKGGISPIAHCALPIDFKPNNLWDYNLTNNIYYIDHHQSHAVYAYISSGFADSDILAIDGRGIHFNCIFIDKKGEIQDLSKKMNIGILWNHFSKVLNFGHLGAGKVMGLSAYGKYNQDVQDLLNYFFDNDFWMPINHDKIVSLHSKEDIAFNLQYITEQKIKQYVYPLQTSNNICVSGGVAYNGYINEMLTKIWSNVYVPPAPGDEGQSLGNYMHAQYTLNNDKHIADVYSGKKYNFKGTVPLNLRHIASAISKGKIVGWFQGKSESGHRALGNRSILADPRNPNIKNIINKTIKKREDFRPFAPVVLEDFYRDYFDTNQPSPYMSRIVPVLSDEIPGVTHIDQTARIQTVNERQNYKLYTLIYEFYKLTKIPMLLNTSFNCQEPIVETPNDAIKTFNKTNLDILVINNWIYT